MVTIQTLYEKSYRLLHLGEDGAPLYADDLSMLNAEVDRLSACMYGYTAVTLEEEASLCCALLVSFAATYTRNLEKTRRLNGVLERVYHLFSGTTARWPGILLSDSFLRAQLAVFAYSFTYDEKFSAEATRLIAVWEGRDLSTEEAELVDLYTLSKELENNCF